MTRQIVLDTETTGLETADGHRVIEIGAVELIDRRVTRRRFHYYINPERQVDAEALAVHGISNEFLADKPRFGDLVDEFLDFIRDAELIIHNADFDVPFLDFELGRLGGSHGVITDYATVLDTLELARKQHPGMRNTLDALCRRYEVDNSSRDLHGALLDARLLAEVYLRMTGGQTTLSLEVQGGAGGGMSVDFGAGVERHIVVRRASEDEIEAHLSRLEGIRKASGGTCLWPEPATSPAGELAEA